MNRVALNAWAAHRAKQIAEQDANRGFLPLGFWWTVRWWVRMWFFRRRRKCPECGAIGTYKAYGGRRAHRRHHDRLCRRLLCKWCGHYRGEDLGQNALADLDRRCWTLQTFWTPPIFSERIRYRRMITPKEELAKIGRINPWAG